jgi:CBS domain-containing membrane protein
MIWQKINNFIGIEFNLISHLEKIISALGGFVGIWLILLISEFFVEDAPLIIASMGASAVLLFAVPHGALSQPWPLVGGHLISALIGVTCAKLLPNPFLAAALAVSLAILVMYYLRCIHPPGGATALAAVLGGESIRLLGYQYVITPILLNVLVILITAIFINFLFPWRRYPISLMKSVTTTVALTPITTKCPMLSHDDLQYALKQMDSFIDVTEEDLTKIYLFATQHSYLMHQKEPLQLQKGHYYSNGQYGNQWSIRQIVDEIGCDEPNGGQIVYKVVAGKERRHSTTGSREEFAQWAKYEVYRDENSWKII